VNLLHEHARATAELFASGNPNRFGRVSWQLDADCAGPHLCDDVHAVADCHIVRPTVPAGDHVVVFGLVSRVTRQPGRWPLVYGHRRYRGWSQTS
jgi:flavin reductase (DIM6/NTAB) family NADH-FMN oxidoreductase RutF